VKEGAKREAATGIGASMERAERHAVAAACSQRTAPCSADAEGAARFGQEMCTSAADRRTVARSDKESTEHDGAETHGHAGRRAQPCGSGVRDNLEKGWCERDAHRLSAEMGPIL